MVKLKDRIAVRNAIKKLVGAQSIDGGYYGIDMKQLEEELVDVFSTCPAKEIARQCKNRYVGLCCINLRLKDATLKLLEVYPECALEQNEAGENIAMIAADWLFLQEIAFKALEVCPECALQQTNRSRENIGMLTELRAPEIALKALEVCPECALQQDKWWLNIGMYAAIHGNQEVALKALEVCPECARQQWCEGEDIGDIAARKGLEKVARKAKEVVVRMAEEILEKY